jgi:hypothetical protein
MKKVILFFLFVFWAKIFFAQTEFAPIGAVWYFDQQETLSFPAHSYYTYESLGDTTINGMAAKKISKIFHSYDGINSFIEYEYICNKDNKVYYFENNQFKLMYDFNLNKGDTLNVEVVQTSDCDSVSVIKVDSVQYEQINSRTLKSIYLSYDLYYTGYNGQSETHKDKITELIGFNNEQVYEFKYTPRCFYIDELFNSPALRCYTDNYLNTYTTSWWLNSYQKCDTLINGKVSVTENQKNNIIISPNPFSDYIKISSPNKYANVQIYNIEGQIIYADKNYADNTLILLSGFTPGFYYVKIKSNSYPQYYVYKLIKI